MAGSSRCAAASQIGEAFVSPFGTARRRGLAISREAFRRFATAPGTLATRVRPVLPLTGTGFVQRCPIWGRQPNQPFSRRKMALVLGSRTRNAVRARAIRRTHGTHSARPRDTEPITQNPPGKGGSAYPARNQEGTDVAIRPSPTSPNFASPDLPQVNCAWGKAASWRAATAVRRLFCCHSSLSRSICTVR
jgi:hypothetical protein